MKKMIVDSVTGVILKHSKPPHPIGTEIDLKIDPLPSDHFKPYPYLWDFVTSSWTIDQGWKDNKDAHKQTMQDHAEAKKDEHARVKALLDDINTDWKDPQGDLLEALYSGFEEILRKDA